MDNTITNCKNTSNKFLKIFFIFVLILVIYAGANMTSAATFGSYTYVELQDGTIMITDYDGTGANNLEIPGTIDGKTVTALGDPMLFTIVQNLQEI